jgi:hypothetical protein
MQMQQHLELQRLANEQMQMQQHLELQRLANEQMQMQQHFVHRQRVREVKLASFENIYRKMERELQDRKRQMAEIIELSNQSYEQRDTYQMEIAAIEQANRKEQEEFEEQHQ